MNLANYWIFIQNGALLPTGISFPKFFAETAEKFYVLVSRDDGLMCLMLTHPALICIDLCRDSTTLKQALHCARYSIGYSRPFTGGTLKVSRDDAIIVLRNRVASLCMKKVIDIHLVIDALPSRIVYQARRSHHGQL